MFISGFNDTGKKLFTGVTNTADKFIGGVVETSDKHSFTIISLIPVINNQKT